MGNVLLTSRICPKYFYRWMKHYKIICSNVTSSRLVLECTEVSRFDHHQYQSGRSDSFQNWVPLHKSLDNNSSLNSILDTFVHYVYIVYTSNVVLGFVACLLRGKEASTPFSSPVWSPTNKGTSLLK